MERQWQKRYKYILEICIKYIQNIAVKLSRGYIDSMIKFSTGIY